MATEGSILLQQLALLSEQGLYESCGMLVCGLLAAFSLAFASLLHPYHLSLHLMIQAELMIPNCSQLGLADQPGAQRNLLLAFADALSADQQYRRALVSLYLTPPCI